MNNLLQSSKKRAVSNIVAYALLISITISLSVLVYSWLRNYVNPNETPDCPDGISLYIEKYDCNSEDNLMLLNIKNNGRYTIDDILVSLNNKSGATQAIFKIDNSKLFVLDEYKEDDLLLKLSFNSELDLAGGINNGSKWTKLGKIGGARNFDGIDDYINLPKLNPIENHPVSFSAWIKWSEQELPPTSGIWGTTGGNSLNSHFEIESTGMRLRLGDLNIRYMNSPLKDKWIYLSFVYDGYNVTYYINGIEINSTSNFTGEIFTGEIHTLGRSDVGRYFKGLIDEVKIFGRALTQEEIINLYTTGYTKNFSSVTGAINLLPSQSKYIGFNYSDFSKIKTIQIQPIFFQDSNFAYCSPIIEKNIDICN